MPGWPERVRAMQANWIGKSEGVRIGFPYEIDGAQGVMHAFTTRADTVMGVTFCAVAAEHPLAQHAAKDNPRLGAFIEECKRGPAIEAELATQEKKGMPTGLFGAPSPPRRRSPGLGRQLRAHELRRRRRDGRAGAR